jgi:hypothetical protein
MSREFRNLADVRIGKLMTALHKETFVVYRKNQIVVKVKDIAHLSGVDYVIEYFKPFASHLMRLGKSRFALEIRGPKCSKSGLMSPSADGSEFYIEIGYPGTIRKLD